MTQILGKQVYRKVTDVPPPVDLVDVFRRARDIPPHVGDPERARPRIVGFQSGIRNDQAALELALDGILVVQDRCLMVEWRRHVARRPERFERFAITHRVRLAVTHPSRGRDVTESGVYSR
ncbi:MAG: CoA-binding protein [Anaeromyxobacteraceae bacterium]